MKCMHAASPQQGRRIALFLALFVSLAVNRSFAQANPASCTISATLVNSCGPWLGATASNYSDAPVVSPDTSNSGFKSQILYHESRIGRQLRIVHTYHPVGTVTFSADETYFYNRANTYLLVNWKPASTWANATGCGSSACNAVDTQITQMANSIKALGSTKIFLAIHHEPENDVTPGTAVNNGVTCASGPGPSYFGSPSDYVNMWHYVHTKFDQLGVTNVVWVMIYQGITKFDPCMTNLLWPGNSRVDWVAWDPYSESGANWNTTVSFFYNQLVSLSTNTNSYKGRPWMLGEFGINGNNPQSDAYQFYADMKTALDNGTYPNIHAYVDYDSVGSSYTQVQYGGNPTTFIDLQEQSDYNVFANDALLP